MIEAPNVAVHSSPKLPAFVMHRMDAWHERYSKEWGGDHLLHGRDQGNGDLLLCSNDYLSLSGEREILDKQLSAMSGARDLLMSAVFFHGDNPQGRLEGKMAAFLRSEAGVLCQSGWAANVGLMQTLAAPGVPVYLDVLAHASLWEGVASAGAMPVHFRHNDASHLEEQLLIHGQGIVAVDSVYSTNGSLCPVASILEMAEKYGSILIVDESHSVGTHGPCGAGIVVDLKLQDRVHFRTLSLAKTFAGRAGFITCPEVFKNYFAIESRHAVFSSCLLNHEYDWFTAAIEFIKKADDRRSRLMDITHRLRVGLDDLGYNVSDGSEQIISLESGPESQTMVLRNAMQARGIFGAVFCLPATSKSRSLVRMSIHSGLTDLEVDRILNVCADIRVAVDLAHWPSTLRRKH
ncbi:MAG: alpha-hydroxyketone-type quorum-sensing autoinducer synthase [Rhodanobacter sp.]